MLLFSFRDSTQSREEALSVLRASGDFVRYAVSVAVQKIQQLEETGHTDGPDGQNTDRTFRFLCDMTRLMPWGLSIQFECSWFYFLQPTRALSLTVIPVCWYGVTPTSRVSWRTQGKRRSAPVSPSCAWKVCSGSSQHASNAFLTGWPSSSPPWVRLFRL